MAAAYVSVEVTASINLYKLVIITTFILQGLEVNKVRGTSDVNYPAKYPKSTN